MVYGFIAAYVLLMMAQRMATLRNAQPAAIWLGRAIVILALAAVPGLVLVTRRADLMDWVLAAIAIAPAGWFALQLSAGAWPARPNRWAFLVPLGFVIIFLGIALSGPLALLNNYDNPLMALGSMWVFFGVLLPLAAAQPPNTAPTPGPTLMIMGAGVAVIVALVPMASAYIGHRAKVAVGDPACLIDTHDERRPPGLWLSARRMLLDATWKGTTLAWLQAGPTGKPGTHHWSFWDMDFVANETRAFSEGAPGRKRAEDGC